jgi:hypothetical protein
MAFSIGRMQIDVAETFTEQVGEAVQNVGITPVPAARQGTTQTVKISTFSPTANDPPAVYLANRRKIRSLLSNPAVQYRGIYISSDEDPEQNGWYVWQPTTIEDASSGVALATGWFSISFSLTKVGRYTNTRPAMIVHANDRTSGLYPADWRGNNYYTDFGLYRTYWVTGTTLSGQPSYFGPMPIAAFTPGNNPSNIAVIGATYVNVATLGAVANSARLGGSSSDPGVLAVSVQDEQVVLAENYSGGMTFANRILGDVVIANRNGDLTNSSTLELNADWEEVYGPDYPWDLNGTFTWSPLNATTYTDAPVMTNGLCRVSLVTVSGVSSLMLEGNYNGTWTEVGRIQLLVNDSSNHVIDTFERCGVLEWRPDRGVIQIDMTASGFTGQGTGNAFQVVVILQRGWLGPRVELYASPLSGAVPPTALLQEFVCAQNTLNTSAYKLCPGSAATVSILGSYPPTGGTFTLTVNGTTSAAINWSTNYTTLCAHVVSALAVMPVAGASLASSAVYCSVTSGNVYLLIGFGKQISTLTVNTASLTGGTGTSGSVALQTPGSIVGVQGNAVVVANGYQQGQDGNTVSTAGTGSVFFSLTNLGDSVSFLAEPWAMMRWQTAAAGFAGVVMTSARSSAGSQVTNQSTAYGSERNALVLASDPEVWYGVDYSLWYGATQEIQECESLSLLNSTANTSDATASNGHAATNTNTGNPAGCVSLISETGLQSGNYRVMIRARVAAGTQVLEMYAYEAAQAQVNGVNQKASCSSTAYAWYDLGEITVTGGSIAIYASNLVGTGTFYLDRMELVPTTSFGQGFGGEQFSNGDPCFARDVAIQALTDTQYPNTLVAR